MQPYFLPYLGYFQLMASVDKFIVYDDVNFIKRGWVNRNNLLVNGAAHLITIPLSNGKRDVLIRDVLVSPSERVWCDKMMRTIQLSYSKAPMFEDVYPMVDELMNSNETSISRLNVNALKWVCRYLSISVEIVESSERYKNRGLERSARLADICMQEHATHYINACGGRSLYDQTMFDPYGIKLSFLEPELLPYSQGNVDFVPGLSILDILMYNRVEVARGFVLDGSVFD